MTKPQLKMALLLTASFKDEECSYHETTSDCLDVRAGLPEPRVRRYKHRWAINAKGEVIEPRPLVRERPA